jgi:hypothetical protein
MATATVKRPAARQNFGTVVLMVISYSAFRIVRSPRHG